MAMNLNTSGKIYRHRIKEFEDITSSLASKFRYKRVLQKKITFVNLGTGFE